MKQFIIALAAVVLAGAVIWYGSFLKPQESMEQAEPGDTVAVHYEGRLEDGTVFDSSRAKGAPIQFTLGAGDVIAGWDQGIQGMKVGEKKQLVIPPELAYGERGFMDVIPPNATLLFDVELVDIQKGK
ncbi:MAG TPA: FKBP-type peptidyl-prolyl cis-trans isomerase [Candidatus Paceibacterota bacterium]|nr:FKBP-type peptidyl-prolyl cis-trans isomerase [Candidatus Paceibacterota bacterium]